MSDTKDTPEWMTDEWLHSAKLLVAELDNLRARIVPSPEGCRVLYDLVQGIALRAINAGRQRVPLIVQRDNAEAERDAARAEVEHHKEHSAAWKAERDAAIRGRNEFAASEVERFVRDAFGPQSKPGGSLWDAVAARAAELRKAAGACPECDGSGTVEKCDWPGEHANRHQEPCPKECKAAGAAAPVDFLAEMRNAKPGPCESWGPMIDATPAADARQPESRVKLPTRFWELMDEINMTGDQRMSRALSMLGVTIESMDARPIAAERAGGAS